MFQRKYKVRGTSSSNLNYSRCITASDTHICLLPQQLYNRTKKNRMKILSALKLLLVAFSVEPVVARTTIGSTKTSERRVPGGASPHVDAFYSEYSTAEGSKGSNDAKLRSGGNEYYSKGKSIVYDSHEEERNEHKNERYLKMDGRMGKKKGGRSDDA